MGACLSDSFSAVTGANVKSKRTPAPTRSRRGRAIAAAAVVVLVSSALVALTGCGGSSDSKPERSAAAAGYDTSCPTFKGTYTIKGTVFNALKPRPARLSVPQGSYDCSDWSGVSTPGRAFNGVEIPPGGSHDFILEGNLRRYPLELKDAGPWTMEVAVPIYGESEVSRASNRLEIDDSDRVWPVANSGGWTEWGKPSLKYVSGDSTPIMDSKVADIRGACSQIGRGLVLGVYKGKLTWFFCS